MQFTNDGRKALEFKHWFAIGQQQVSKNQAKKKGNGFFI
jgi:hypothetical protein